jgi:serine/threonine-protein kinase
MLDRRYHVRSRIAHGGMATVYLATDTRLDRQVALKVMHAELARDGDFVARFIGEAKSVARLSHPNIVAVFDQGADGSYLYLAMEYVPGRTLRALQRERGWLPWSEALEVLEPVLAGLAAAHQAGIVHRDVKPENVLLTADGRVKVVDFGLARASAAMGNTQAGMIIGSVAYIAPEQVTGAVTDARTDVYAAGVMLFELLTGRQPFTGESPLAVAYAHVNADVPAPSEWVGGIPPAVDQLVRAATSRDPRWRPADAGAFLRAVRALRGVPEPGDPATGAYGAAAAPGGYPPGPYPAAGTPATPGSHTMVVGPGYDGAGQLSGGYAKQNAGFGGAAYPSAAGYQAADGYGSGDHGDFGHESEPLLQRWLFSRRLALLAGGTAALLLIGGGGWWLSSGRYTPLPAVAGLTAVQATQALTQAGFKVHDGTAVIDDNVPKGDVVGTSPAGRALPGSTIMLTFSLGPKMITVPPVTGSVQQAMATLKAAGLTVSPTAKAVGAPPGTTVVLGAVAGTTPAAGTSWPENKPVFVNQVEGLALPNMVGQALTAMQQWASQNHITLQPTQVNNSNQQAGIIVAQSLPQGTPVKPGSVVSVSVSNGPAMVQIPGGLRGQDFHQVQQQLEQLGFKVDGKKFGPGNTVFFVQPAGEAPQGSTITVWYGGF